MFTANPYLVVAVAHVDGDIAHCFAVNEIIARARADDAVAQSVEIEIVVAVARIDRYSVRTRQINRIVARARPEQHVIAVCVFKFNLARRADGYIIAFVVEPRDAGIETDVDAVDIVFDRGNFAAIIDGGIRHDVTGLAVGAEHHDLLVADVFERERFFGFDVGDNHIVAALLKAVKAPIISLETNDVAFLVAVDRIAAALIFDDLIRAVEADNIIALIRFEDHAGDRARESISIFGALYDVGVGV